MSKFKYLSIFLLFFHSTVHGQRYTRLNIEAGAGVPTSLTFFSPTFSMYGGVGVRYTLIKEVSFAGHLEFGTMGGKNNTLNSAVISPDNNNNFKNYSNNFVQYTLEGQLNLEKLLNLRKYFHRLNPFLVFGGGWIYSNVSAIRVDEYNRTYMHTFQVAYAGINVRYYMNPSIDVLVGTNFCMAQTYYIDAVPADKTLDNYLLSYVGISYKIGARKDKQHIEWNNLILKDRIYIPDIEKHVGQPLDDAGNYFIYHRDTIARLQAQNAELMEKTAKLESKTSDLEKKNDAQQKQLDSMQSQVNAVKALIDTMQQVRKAEQTISETPNQVQSSNPDIAKLQVENAKLLKKVNEQQKQIESLTNEVNSLKKGNKKQIQNNGVHPKNDATKPANGRNIQSEISSDKSNSVANNDLTTGLNKIDGVVAPIARYNIIAGSYQGEKFALIFRDKMRSKGFQAAVFKSGTNMHRVCVYVSQNRNEAIQALKKVRAEIVNDAWIHVYNQK